MKVSEMSTPTTSMPRAAKRQRDRARSRRREAGRPREAKRVDEEPDLLLGTSG